MEPVQYSASTAEPIENKEKIQERLQQLIKGSREGWTYAIFWESSCDYSGSLLGWGDGYYEGEGDKGKAETIMSSTAEQEHRKKVLLELNSLISGSTPTIDDTEWLFLVSMAQSFNVDRGGLPIQAYLNNRPVWVSGAERLANSGCDRASEGQVFGLQTLVCIPLAKGVVELGSTEIINQNSDLIHKLRSLWKEEDDSSCWIFWRRVYSTCDSSLFVSDVQIGRKVKGLEKDKINVVQESIAVREQNEKKERKLKSKVWDEFTKSKGEDGEQLAICNHCGGVFDGSSKNGTTHLKKHLESMKCRAKRNGGDGNGDTSTKIRDLASPGVIKERSYVLTMEMKEQNEKKKRKRTSKVWDEFTKSKGKDGEQLAICNHCGGEFDGSSKNVTTHLKKHLESMKCPAKINGGDGDGDGDTSTKIRDLASPVVIKERSYVLTMEMKVQSETKKRKRKSKVWDEFTWSEGEDGKQWAICNHCGREFDGSSEKGTTHLNDHLNTKR